MSLLSRLLRFHGGNVRLEDFFTEIFAHLLSTYPDLCTTWLDQSGILPTDNKYSHTRVITQRSFKALGDHEHSSRPDIVIEVSEAVTSEIGRDQDLDDVPVQRTDIVMIESKVGSREGEDQLKRYAEQLAEVPNARRRKLVYITRDYDPKDSGRIASGLQRSDTPVEFLQARWHESYRVLEDYRSTSLPHSDLIQEVLLFIQQHGMSETNRLSAADVLALSGMTKMLAFMRETLSGEVEAKLQDVSQTKLARRNQTLQQLVQHERYFSYAFMDSQFWCGAGFYLEQEVPEDYPWLSVLVEVGPQQSGREDIIDAMRSFAADCSRCQPYDLDDPSGWPGLEWALDLRELLTAEDHITAARNFFLESLDDVSRMREQYPDLPWGSGTSG